MEYWQLKQKQSLPLEAKIEMSKRRIIEWYEHWDGQVYVSFSGGKDSTVLLHLVRSIYPHVPAVFVDTGLEYPEIKEFAKKTDKTEILKPSMDFRQVIQKYGYPVISKKTASKIYKLKYCNLSEKYKNYLLHGDERGKMGKLADCWKYLVQAPFKISDNCCGVMKKNPFKKYERKTKRKPYIGTMADEGQDRQASYLKFGCNAFESLRPASRPLSFWNEADIWEYIRQYNVKYSKIYDLGYDRTGCMFCMFGVHLEEYPNRFQRMAITHPKQYRYCIENLGIGKVLDYINVPYKVYENGIIGVMKKDEKGDKYEQLKVI